MMEFDDDDDDDDDLSIYLSIYLSISILPLASGARCPSWEGF